MLFHWCLVKKKIVREVSIFTQFYRFRNWGSQRLRDLPTSQNQCVAKLGWILRIGHLQTIRLLKTKWGEELTRKQSKNQSCLYLGEFSHCCWWWVTKSMGNSCPLHLPGGAKVPQRSSKASTSPLHTHAPSNAPDTAPYSRIPALSKAEAKSVRQVSRGRWWSQGKDPSVMGRMGCYYTSQPDLCPAWGHRAPISKEQITRFCVATSLTRIPVSELRKTSQTVFQPTGNVSGSSLLFAQQKRETHVLR